MPRLLLTRLRLSVVCYPVNFTPQTQQITTPWQYFLRVKKEVEKKTSKNTARRSTDSEPLTGGEASKQQTYFCSPWFQNREARGKTRKVKFVFWGGNIYITIYSYLNARKRSLHSLDQKEMLRSSQRAPAANESRERLRQFKRHFRHVPFKAEVTVWIECAHMDVFLKSCSIVFTLVH